MTMYQLLKLGPQFPAIAILFFILGYPTSVSAEEPLPLLNAAYLTFPPMAYTSRFHPGIQATGLQREVVRFFVLRQYTAHQH